MDSVIIPILLGLLITALGVTNMKGNISTLHWYHRHRVTEENRLPFGRTIGLGTIIMGLSLVLFGICSFIADKAQSELFIIIGSAIVIISIVVGLALSFFAMIKYNKGIF